jgi:ArsR family transcriptional regulator
MSLTPLQLFKNLSDETRWVLCCCLKRWGAVRVRSLHGVDQSQPKISRHLAMLRESGLLLDRRAG